MGSRSQTWLSDFTFTFPFHALEKEMATHSSVLTWRIPGMGEPGGLLSMGSHRVEHNWSDLAEQYVFILLISFKSITLGLFVVYHVWCISTRQLWCWVHFNFSYKYILFRINIHGLMLRPPDVKSQLIGKDPDAGKDWGQEKRVTEDEMVGWHYWLNRYEFEQTTGDSEEQGSLMCCSSWGDKE